MKNNPLILFFFLNSIFISISFSQTYISGDVETSQNRLTKENIENSLIFTQIMSDNIVENNLNNTVFIDQLGNANEIAITANAKKSNLNILQQGDNNNVYIEVTANQINETVFQLGNNNNFVDFSNSSNIHNLELVQNGNSQNLIWYGGNTISEKLIINMKGENQSIIVRNFN